MTRPRKDPETALVVWWEDLPQEFLDLPDKQIAEADEIYKRRQEKRAQKRAEKKVEKK